MFYSKHKYLCSVFCIFHQDDVVDFYSFFYLCMHMHSLGFRRKVFVFLVPGGFRNKKNFFFLPQFFCYSDPSILLLASFSYSLSITVLLKLLHMLLNGRVK